MIDYRALAEEFTRPPPDGTPAAELTERDRVALAIAARVPVEIVMTDNKLIIRTIGPIAVCDREGGGYLVINLHETPRR